MAKPEGKFAPARMGEKIAKRYSDMPTIRWPGTMPVRMRVTLAKANLIVERSGTRTLLRIAERQCGVGIRQQRNEDLFCTPSPSIASRKSTTASGS